MGRFAKPADVVKNRSSRLPFSQTTNNRRSLLARPTVRTSGISQLPKFAGNKISKTKDKTLKSSNIGNRKSVRFEGINSSAEKNDNNEAAKEKVKEKILSQVGEDFVFEEDPAALASILNDEGVSSELLRKSQIAEAKKEGASADEFLLADGRPSLCRRIPTNRTSSILPDGRPSLSSRISQGPGRVARTSTTGRQSVSIHRGSVIRSSARDSLFSFIERRYSHRQQVPASGTMNPPPLPRPSILLSAKSKQQKKVEFKDENQAKKTKEEELLMSVPRRVLNNRQVLNLQNIASPALRVSSPVHPIHKTPASRVQKSAKKTPGISQLANGFQNSDRMKDKLATVLQFPENDENKSPEIAQPRQKTTQPEPKTLQSKLQQPRKSMSRIRPTSQINKRQSLQKKTTNITNKTEIQNGYRNSARFSVGKRQTGSKNRDEIKTQYVKADLKSGEELVQPKTLNENVVKSTKDNCEKDLKPKITSNTSKISQKSGLIDPRKSSLQNAIMTPQTLNDVTKPTKVTSQLKKPESRIPTCKAKKANIDDVLELMRKKLAKINRRSVQAEFSSVIKSVEMGLAAVSEDEAAENSESVSDQTVENARSPSKEKESSSQGLKSWKEVLASESSPTWKDVLKKDLSSRPGDNISEKEKILPTVQSDSVEVKTLDALPSPRADAGKELRASYEDCLKQVEEVEAESKNLEERMQGLQIEKQKLGNGTKGISKLFTPRNLQMPDMSKTHARIMKVLDSKLPTSSTKIKLPVTKYFGPVISPPESSITSKNVEVSQKQTLATRCQPGAVKVASNIGALQNGISTTGCQPEAVKATSSVRVVKSENSTIRWQPGAVKSASNVLPTTKKTLSKYDDASNSSFDQSDAPQKSSNMSEHSDHVTNDSKSVQNGPNMREYSKEEQGHIKSVKWADCSHKPPKSIVNPTENQFRPMPNLDVTIKPEFAKNMNWAMEGHDRKNKITSGRIGVKSGTVSSKKKNESTISEKCPIMPVISPKDGLRNRHKNSPILKEKLVSDSDSVFQTSPKWHPTFAELVKTPPQKGAVRSTSSSLGALSESLIQNATILSPNFCTKYGIKYDKHAENSWIDNLNSSPAVTHDLIHSKPGEKVKDEQKKIVRSANGQGFCKNEDTMSKFAPEISKNPENVEKKQYIQQSTVPTLESLSIIGIEVRKNPVEAQTLEKHPGLPVPNIVSKPFPEKNTPTSHLTPPNQGIADSKVEKSVHFKHDDSPLLHHKSEIDINGNHVLVPDHGYNKETNDSFERSGEDVKETKVFSPFVASSLSKFFEGLKKSEENPKYNLMDFTIIEENGGNGSRRPRLPAPLIPIPSGGQNDWPRQNPGFSTSPQKIYEKESKPVNSGSHNQYNPVKISDLPTEPLTYSASSSSNRFIPVQSPGSTEDIFTNSLTSSSNQFESVPKPDLTTDTFSQPISIQFKPVPKPALLPERMFRHGSDLMQFSGDDVKTSEAIKKPLFGFSHQDMNVKSTMIAAPKPIKPPPPQTPAAFRMLRKKFRESPTPKKCRARSPFSMQSPSRGINKNSNKKSSLLTSSPSIKSICTKRFAEALLDEEVALFTCRNFRNTIMTPSKKIRKASSMNPLGRVLLEGDDSHFIPLSPIPIAKPTKASAAIKGSAFSAFTPGT